MDEIIVYSSINDCLTIKVKIPNNIMKFVKIIQVQGVAQRFSVCLVCQALGSIPSTKTLKNNNNIKYKICKL